MTTGKPAFSGKSRASLIAAILTAEPPPMESLQPMAPVSLKSNRQEMPGERSRRTLAECQRPGRRVEVDCRRWIAGKRNLARSRRAREMGAHELDTVLDILPARADERHGLVDGHSPAPAADVFPCCSSLRCERRGFVVRRAHPGKGRFRFCPTLPMGAAAPGIAMARSFTHPTHWDPCYECRLREALLWK